jgi:hypothetical protein
MRRDKCNAELAVAESREANLGNAVAAAARKDLPPAMVQALAGDFEALSRAGARLQQCLAGAHERERLASFRNQCASACDKPKLSAGFADAARDLLDKASKL